MGKVYKHRLNATFTAFAEDDDEAQERETLTEQILQRLSTLEIEKLRRLASALDGDSSEDDESADQFFDSLPGAAVSHPHPNEEEPIRAGALSTGGHTVRSDVRPSAAGGSRDRETERISTGEAGKMSLADARRKFGENKDGLRQLGIDSPERLQAHCAGKHMVEPGLPRVREKRAPLHFSERGTGDRQAWGEQTYRRHAQTFRQVGTSRDDFLASIAVMSPEQFALEQRRWNNRS